VERLHTSPVLPVQNATVGLDCAPRVCAVTVQLRMKVVNAGRNVKIVELSTVTVRASVPTAFMDQTVQLHARTHTNTAGRTPVGRAVGVTRPILTFSSIARYFAACAMHSTQN